MNMGGRMGGSTQRNTKAESEVIYHEDAIFQGYFIFIFVSFGMMIVFTTCGILVLS